MVYVLSKSGKALMPTKNFGKVRILLKDKKAKVIQNKPFTIQLLYKSKEYTQPISLGIDSGYSYIGYSAITVKEELASGELTLLKGMSERIETKAMHRRNSRSRLRYRKPRFDNRTKSKPKGWLAPSLQHKLDSHIRFIGKLNKILPITNTVVEIGSFDTHLLKNPDVSGVDYQKGEQQGFYNTREYIFHRDNHTCQICKTKDKVLQVHHIGFWKGDRGNRPANLMAICTTCHVPKNHLREGILWGLQAINKGFKEATYMTLIRTRITDTLGCDITYGYITKSKRIELGLNKSHNNDAFIVAGGKDQVRTSVLNYSQTRRNNRSLERFYDAKYIDIRTGKRVSGQDLFSGRRTRNKNLNTENLHIYRGEKVGKGRRSIRKQIYFYQPNDLVRYEGKIYTVRGTQNKGNYIALREIKKVPNIKLLEPYRFRRGIYV